MKDEIGKFWVVTKPTKHSVLIDIVFEANVTDMMIQCKGGLLPDDVLGIYKEEKDAEEYGKELLKFLEEEVEG